MSFELPPRCVTEKTLQQPAKYTEASGTLLRLTKIHQILSKNEGPHRVALITKLNTLWEKCIPKAILSDEAKSDINNYLVEAKKEIGDELFQHYLKALNLTPLPLLQCIKQFKKDLATVTLCAPLKLSNTGIEGPTLLVNYWRTTIHKYVAKLSDWEELLSSRVYQAFAQGFSEPNMAFKVPKSTGIDITSGLHHTVDGTLISEKEDVYIKLKEEFFSLVELSQGKVNGAEDKPLLMYSEMVEGENLYDFFVYKYSALSPTLKAKFFEQLGRISLLDLLLGNIDRLVQTALIETPDKTVHDFDDGHANLGNIMVSWSGNSDDCPTFHPIDNGLQALNEDSRDVLYIEFLKKTLNPANNQFKILAIKIQESIKKRLENGDIEIKPKIFDDLEVIGIPAILTGLLEMNERLKKELIPAWESLETSKTVKKQLIKVLPDLAKAIDERIGIFKQLSE